LTGYIVLAVFIGLVVSHTAVFFTGYSRARKKAELERIEDENRRLQSDREFQKEKENIQKEVFGNASIFSDSTAKTCGMFPTLAE
jgi:hypothetical protein